MNERCVDLSRARSEDWPAVRTLLAQAKLPLDGVPETLEHFVVARDGNDVIGVAGLEHYGSSALLRSVAVDDHWRGTGIGRLLVDRALDEARTLGVDDVYLLTTTAQDYFPKFGFACVRRETLPAALGASAEMRGACPETAIAMKRETRSEKREEAY
jgi:amino-acid N-acetyltransferase